MSRGSKRLLRQVVLTGVLACLILAPTLSAQPDPTGLLTRSGDPVPSEEIDQGQVLLVFWASWSPRCRNIVERVNAIEKEWGDRAKIVMVNFQEDAGKVRGFLEDKDARAVSYLDPDGRFSKEHAITFLPGLLVLVDGKIAYRGRMTRKPDDLLTSILTP